jgi:hypothetical protein
LIWPLLVAAVYAMVAIVPDSARRNIPAPVLKWAPFAVAYFSTGWTAAAMPSAAIYGGTGHLLAWGFPLLVFGLICRMEDAEDNIARVLIAIGGFCALAGGLANISYVFRFSHVGVFGIIHNILFIFIILGMIGSIIYAIPKQWWPGAAFADPFLPIVTAVLIVWAPLSAILVGLSSRGIGMLTVTLHLLVNMFGYYLVLMLTAPEALGALKDLLKGGGSKPAPPPGGGYPPQQPPGGGYPPQGGGYPPPGGGYPPQGGGYPPPGGGYPPQGGGYPPQGGGGWPQG